MAAKVNLNRQGKARFSRENNNNADSIQIKQLLASNKNDFTLRSTMRNYFTVYGIMVFLALNLLLGCKRNEAEPIETEQFLFSNLHTFEIQNGENNLRYVGLDSVSGNLVVLFGKANSSINKIAMQIGKDWTIVDMDEKNFYPIKYSVKNEGLDFSLSIVKINKVTNTIDIEAIDNKGKVPFSEKNLAVSKEGIDLLTAMEAYHKNDLRSARMAAIPCSIISTGLKVVKSFACASTIVNAGRLAIAYPSILPAYAETVNTVCGAAFEPISAKCTHHEGVANCKFADHCFANMGISNIDPGCINAAIDCYNNAEKYIDDYYKQKNPAHSTADPHLMTLDGTSFDFQSHGEYIVTKSSTDNFEIQVRQEDVYKTGRATMNTGLAVQTGTDVVCVTVKPNRLFVNKQVQDLNTLTALALKDGASIKKTKDNGRDVINITNKNGDLLKVIIQGTDYLDYYLYLTENRKSKVIGLLGNYDDNKNNDIQIRNGESILINGSLDFNKLHSNYADSWRIAQSNSLFYYDAGKTTDSYTEKDFPRSLQTLTAEQKIKAEATCRAAGVSTEPFLSNCITDVAITNNPEMAQSAVFGQQNDSRNSKPIPIVQEGVDVKTITSGRYFSYLLKTDGTLWACGRSSDGVFGVGNTAVDTKGFFMKIMDGVKDIAKGEQDSHMLILKNDNTVWAFGRNEWGQIGNGVSNATPVFPAVQIMKDVKLLAVTSVNSYVIKTDNSLWAFGQSNGMFGNGNFIASNVPVKITDGVKDIATNYSNTLILKTDNSLWRASGFVKIMDNVKSMNVGNFCTMIIKNDNSLWVEGSNEAGQIGLGTLTKSNGYTKLLDDVQSVAGGAGFMYILKNDKTLWSVGNNSLGLLGVQTSQRGVLNKVLDDVKSVYCGPLSVFVVKSDNMLWALGNYSDIGYGLENNIYRYKFVPINVK